MADDEADFTLRLIDKISGPSRRAKRSLDKLASSARDVNRADRITGRFKDKNGRWREANGRFIGSGRRGGGGGGGFSGGAMDVLKGNLLTQAVLKIGELATSMARATGETIMFGQNARLAFNQLAKHGVEGSKLFEHARDLSRRFGLDVQDTTKSYQKFLALQFNPQEIDKLVKMGADLRVLGNDAENVQGIFTALGQIKSKDRLQAEEMLQLAERGISQKLVWDELGKALGKTTDQIRQLQQAGKIKGDEALAAIQRAVMFKLNENELGDAGKNFADTTIEGFIGRAKAFAQDAGITLVERLTEPLTRMGGKAFQRFGLFLESDEGAKVIDDIARALGRAGELASVFFDSFGPAFMDTFKELGSGAQQLLGAFGGGKGATTEAIVRAIGRAFGELSALAVGFSVGLAAAISGMTVFAVGAWEVGKAIVGGLFEPFATSIGKLLNWWDTLTAIWNDKGLNLAEKAWEIGGHIIDGVIGGIENQANMMFKAVDNIAKGLIEAFRKTLGIHSPSLEFREIGIATSSGFAIGIERGIGRIERASDRMLFAADVFGPETAPPRFDAGTLGDGGGRSMSVSVTQHIEIHGGGDAAETAKLAARESRREIEAFFRQLAME